LLADSELLLALSPAAFRMFVGSELLAFLALLSGLLVSSQAHLMFNVATAADIFVFGGARATEICDYLADALALCL
jgi:hypothetical protein